MEMKYKKHDKVKLLIDPNPEYVEYHTENTGEEQVVIKKGALGEVNTILPNGEYHVKVFDENGKEFAYVVMDEDYLEAI